MTMRNTPWLLLAGLTVGFAANAGDTAPAGNGETVNGYYNGVTVAIDPATGRLRAPTAAEQAALRQSAAKSVRGPSASGMPRNQAEANKTIRRLADGSVMAMVPEDLMSQVVAVQKPDGSIHIQHVGPGVEIGDVHDHSEGEIK